MEREKVSLLISYLSLPYRFSWFRHVIHTGSLAAPAPEDTTLLRTIPPSNKNSDRIFPAAGKRTTYYLKNFLMQYTMGRLQISTACPERAELSKSTESVADLLLENENKWRVGKSFNGVRAEQCYRIEEAAPFIFMDEFRRQQPTTKMTNSSSWFTKLLMIATLL